VGFAQGGLGGRPIARVQRLIDAGLETDEVVSEPRCATSRAMGARGPSQRAHRDEIEIAALHPGKRLQRRHMGELTAAVAESAPGGERDRSNVPQLSNEEPGRQLSVPSLSDARWLSAHSALPYARSRTRCDSRPSRAELFRCEATRR